MEIRSFFRHQNVLSEQAKLDVQKLQKNHFRLNKTNSVLDSELKMILDLINDGLNINQVQFIKEVFFEFQISLHKIVLHKERLFKEMTRLNEFIEGSREEAMFLVNIYRNVISDLFDPYISLFTACFQFKEGSFINFLYSNLGQGERNKYEFCVARMGSTTLLEGYSSIARNAISHAGTDGITYGNGDILFRNIKRGVDPKVETVTWTNERLQLQILSLIRTIRTIDLAIEIFGVDILDIIKNNEALSTKFLDEVLTLNDRLKLQAPFDQMIEKINSSKELSDRVKLDAFSNIFFLQCHKRDIKVDRIAFNTEKKTALIEVPHKEILNTDHGQVVEKFLELLRYGIVAEPCFRNAITTFAILEVNNKNEKYKLVLSSEEFKKYNFEIAGLWDLLHQSITFINGVEGNFLIDFDKLYDIERNSLARKFPRKKK